MIILITGGAGFIGSNLAIKIKEKYPSYEIIVLDNLKRRGSELNIPRLMQKGIKFIHGDIRNKEDFEDIPKFDVLLECSAEPSVLAGINSSPSYLLNTNLFGTINCLEFVRLNKAKIIFLSTSRVYPMESINSLNFIEQETRFDISFNLNGTNGISEKGISEKFSTEGARSLYGTTKLCSELLINEYASNFGTEAIINRCSLIAGPWQMGKIDQGVITLWIASHLFKRNLYYIGYGGSGKQVRDVLHIDDLFDLIDIQIHNFNNFKGQVFNVGGGKNNSISLKELTSICEQVTGKNIFISSIQEDRKSDLKWFITDSTKIQNMAGWFPKKNIREIITDIANWIKENQDCLKGIL